jgi:hypothetical protein
MQPAVDVRSDTVSAPPTSQACEHPAPWTSLQRVLFRFAFLYLTLYLSYALTDHAWAFGAVGKAIANLWNSAMSWVGVHFFHFDAQDMRPIANGGGDALVEYIQIFATGVLAIAGACIWSFLDRSRTQYDRLYAMLRVLVRYSLAYIILDYGFGKLIPLQMKPPQLWQLLQPYGELIPQDVLWHFMGVSQPYTVFTGFIEVLGGLLLLFKRTTTLGAIVTAAALVNVVALNLCYDVDVKLYSIHLLLMALFLLLPDVKPLVELLVLRRAAAPSSPPTISYRTRVGRMGARLVWLVFVGFVLYTNIGERWKYFRSTYIDPETPPSYGVLEVESFVRNGHEVPPSSTEPRWKNMSFDRSSIGRGPAEVHIRTMDEPPNQWTIFWLQMEWNPATNGMTLISRNPFTGKTERYPFTYQLPDSDDVLLDGQFRGDHLSIRLRKMDTSQYFLAKRRFRWVHPNALWRPRWSR